MKVLLGFIVLLSFFFDCVAALFRNLGLIEAVTNTTQVFSVNKWIRPQVREAFGPSEDLVPGLQNYQGSNVLSLIGYNLCMIFELLSRIM